MKRKNSIIIFGSIILLLFFACTKKTGAQTQVTEQSELVEQSEPDKQQFQPGLPMTIISYDNSYTINSFEISKDDDGNTKIIAPGTGFEILKFINGSAHIAVWCDIISNGKKYEPKSASQGSKGITFFYSTSVTPDSLVFYPGDDETKKTTIKCQ